MTIEARFDKAIIDQVKAFTEEISKHQEIRSVAVIIDWDMPSSTGLPTGLWQHKLNADPLMGSISMAAQMGRAITNQQHTTMQIIAKAVDAQEKGKVNDVPATAHV